jgi:hypothetical protein
MKVPCAVAVLVLALCAVEVASIHPHNKDLETLIETRSQVQERYSSSEHLKAVDAAWTQAKADPGIDPVAKTIDSFHLNALVTVKVGEAAAINGDFIGPQGGEKHLCDMTIAQIKTWYEGADGAANEKKFDQKKFQRIDSVIQWELQAKTAAEYQSQGKDRDQDFARSTHNPPQQPFLGNKAARDKADSYYEDILVKKSTYMEGAKSNMDHFRAGGCAQRAVGTIFTEAYNRAQAAMKEKDAKKKKAGLEGAMKYLTLAVHFASDQFAAGHMRTPRDALPRACMIQAAGHGLSKCMHDEDNEYGLQVDYHSPADGKVSGSGTAYGDEYYDDPRNSGNKAKLLECMKAFFVKTFTPAKKLDPNYPKCFPTVSDKHNRPAMFKVDAKGKAMIREPLFVGGKAVPVDHVVTYSPLSDADNNCVALFLVCAAVRPAIQKFMTKTMQAVIAAQNFMHKTEDLAKKAGAKLEQGWHAVEHKAVEIAHKAGQAVGAAGKELKADATKAGLAISNLFRRLWP